MLLYISDQCIFVVVVVYFWLRHWCCIFVVVIEVYQDFYNTSHAIWCWKLRYKIFYAYEKSINEIYMLRWMNGNIRKDHTKWRNSFNNRGDSWMKKWKRELSLLFCSALVPIYYIIAILFCTSANILIWISKNISQYMSLQSYIHINMDPMLNICSSKNIGISLLYLWYDCVWNVCVVL